jgi:hypothetical protein
MNADENGVRDEASLNAILEQEIRETADGVAERESDCGVQAV